MVSSRHIDAQFRHWLGRNGKTTTVDAEEDRMTCFVKVESSVVVGSCAESEVAVQADVDSVVLFLQFTWERNGTQVSQQYTHSS